MTTNTFHDLVRREGITLEMIQGATEKPPPSMEGYTAWTTTLRYDGRKLVTPFFTMPGSAPQPAQVLFVLCNEARLFREPFETWAAALNFNPDSRAAYALWESIQRMVPKLAKFLDRRGHAFLEAAAVPKSMHHEG